MGFEFVIFKKIMLFGMMFFCILFNYMIFSDIKDVLVVMVEGFSVEIMFFLKMWVNLFMVVGFMFLYMKLVNVLLKEVFFFMVILLFMVFFGVFGFVLYFFSYYVYFMVFVDKFLNILGLSFFGLFVIMSIWSFCLFYVMVEFWGSVVIFVLFWGFVN